MKFSRLLNESKVEVHNLLILLFINNYIANISSLYVLNYSADVNRILEALTFESTF